ncbi:MAG: ribosome-associated translation inhibitor RaiA [Gammaproteobacteria bacterium]|jgi:putative sigma-54 modulation protein|nr:ribosome-associated translation inhibitor RaiA [Gammaproteobacteria bacterium]MBI5617163.1 ribosome-associated translation inhibitor RaiA [Gammaproteobacteria bacterium]
MQLNISGHHVELSPALNDYIKSKLQRIERHFDQVVDAHVVLGVERQRHKAEATIHVSGNTLHAASEHDDMYAAIDLLLDKLDRQVRKHKEKVTNHHHREAATRGVGAAEE